MSELNIETLAAILSPSQLARIIALRSEDIIIYCGMDENYCRTPEIESVSLNGIIPGLEAVQLNCDPLGLLHPSKRPQEDNDATALND